MAGAKVWEQPLHIESGTRRGHGPEEDVRVIFLVRNPVDVIYSVFQREQDRGPEWIGKHYRHLSADANQHDSIHLRDTLGLEKLFNAYLEQTRFDVLFLRYERLFGGHQGSVRALCDFIGTKLQIEARPRQNHSMGSFAPQHRHDHRRSDIDRTYSGFTERINRFNYRYKWRNNTSFAHLVNPFHCPPDNPAYLHYAQPVTLRSMERARTAARKRGIEVSLLAACFPGDMNLVPESFQATPQLTRSTAEVYPGMTSKRLPFIQDLLDRLYHSCEAEYLVLSNVDIALFDNFYTWINDAIKRWGFEGMTITRRDNLPKFSGDHRLGPDDLDYFYQQVGQDHPGYDCFVFRRDLYREIDMGQLFAGHPPWGAILVKQLRWVCGHKTFRNKHLTFHIGKDEVWRGVRRSPLAEQNRQNAHELIRRIKHDRSTRNL